MKNPFDIMKVLSDDTLAWLECAEELSAARVRVWELLGDSPGEYIIFNQETKTLVAHFSIHEAPQIPEWWRQEDDYVGTPQPAIAATSAVAASADDSAFDNDFDEYVEVLQPVA